MPVFNEDVNLQVVDTSTGAAGALRSLSERLGEFKAQQDQIIGNITNEFASRAMDSYVSSAENDIRENLNLFAKQHTGQAQGDLQAFNDKAEAYRKATVEQASPLVRGRIANYLDDNITHKRMGIQSTQLDTERKLQSIDIETNIKESQKESNTYAIDGNLENALLNYSERLVPLRQRQVERGEISQKSADLLNSYDLKNIQSDYFRGEVRRTYERDGALSALKLVNNFTKTKDTMIGLNETDRAEMQKNMYAEIQSLITLDNKIEAEEKAQREALQEDTAILIAGKIYSGEDATQDVLEGIANKTLSLEDGTKMINLLRNQGTGTDDPNLVFSIQQKIANGESMTDINNVIVNNTGSRLTQSTAGNLLQMATNSSSKNPKYNDPLYKEAKAYISSQLANKGILGALDTESTKRIGQAQLDLFKRSVMGDENPLSVADEIIDSRQIQRDKVVNIRSKGFVFSERTDTKEFIAEQTERLRKGEITEDAYNAMYEEVQALDLIRESYSEYMKIKQEYIKNER